MAAAMRTRALSARSVAGARVAVPARARVIMQVRSEFLELRCAVAPVGQRRGQGRWQQLQRPHGDAAAEHLA